MEWNTTALLWTWRSISQNEKPRCIYSNNLCAHHLHPFQGIFPSSFPSSLRCNPHPRHQVGEIILLPSLGKGRDQISEAVTFTPSFNPLLSCCNLPGTCPSRGARPGSPPDAVQAWRVLRYFSRRSIIGIWKRWLWWAERFHPLQEV